MPAKAPSYTPLSMKDGCDPLEVDVLQQYTLMGTWSFKRISSVQSLDPEGAKSKDTIKMDEPVAQQIRRKIKLQHLSEPRDNTVLLDKPDKEMRELLIRLIAQKKEQKDQIKAMNLVLKEVLAQQTTIVSKLHDTETDFNRVALAE